MISSSAFCTEGLGFKSPVSLRLGKKKKKKKKKEATHGITLIRDMFHHLPELQPNIHNKVWYFICTSPFIEIIAKIYTYL